MPAVLELLTLLIVGMKVFEDVITKKSGPFYTAVLWLIRQHIPSTLTGLFTLVTSTGAAIFLGPATVLLNTTVLRLKHRRKALLVASSMAWSGLLTYFIKALVNRSRPDPWGATRYSSSSFPIGHTLRTTALATALVLCVTRVWPGSRYAALALAGLWIGLMELSRLVLGSHWPTDVLAAFCLGVFAPMAISMALDLYQHGLASI